MEASSHSRGGRGLWNKPRVTRVTAYSKQTQDMLRLMMQESKLTNLQRKHINESLRNGTALPLPPDPKLLPSPPQPKTSKSVQRRLPGRPQRRSAEACCSGNSYSREEFRPTPTRDLDKEKRRLQNIMATGEEEPTSASSTNVPTRWTPEVEERDQYQEVLDEIEERRQFLADMASLGQEKQYIHIINTEISQKIRELEILDKCRQDLHSERADNVDSKEATAERTDL